MVSFHKQYTAVKLEQRFIFILSIHSKLIAPHKVKTDVLSCNSITKSV